MTPSGNWGHSLQQTRSNSPFRNGSEMTSRISAAAERADTEPYHDGSSLSFVFFGSFVVDCLSLLENRTPIGTRMIGIR
jgi:hypothetical protein